MILYLEAPWFIRKLCFMRVYVGDCDVVPGEDDICPGVQEPRHPVHVAAGGVQDAEIADISSYSSAYLLST